MKNIRRTQADRTAATRAALIDAARGLFADHGYAGVGTEAIVKAAGVSRGALYHHFSDKTELYEATLRAVESDVTDRIATQALASGTDDFVSLMLSAVEAWLDACEAPEVRRIILEDGPSVLGWARWREVIQPYAMSLIEGLLEQAAGEGALVELPTRPLAHALVAVADEAAMYVVSAENKKAAREEMTLVMRRVLESLTTNPH